MSKNKKDAKAAFDEVKAAVREMTQQPKKKTGKRMGFGLLLLTILALATWSRSRNR